MPPFQRISAWASLNPKKSRFIIAIATILSVFLHYYYGLFLFAYEVVIPYSFAIGGIIIGVTAAFFYPFKHHQKGIFAYSYRKQKSLDFLIFAIGGLLVMYLGNRRAANVYTESEMYVAIQQELGTDEAASISPYIPVSAGSKAKKKPDFVLSKAEMRRQIKRTFKEVKKVLRNEIRALKKQRKKGDRTDGLKALLTVLTILGALTLGFLVAALACSLSCNGNELAGTIVLIVGWLGILILSIFIIRRIFSKDKRESPKPKNQDSSYPY